MRVVRWVIVLLTVAVCGGAAVSPRGTSQCSRDNLSASWSPKARGALSDSRARTLARSSFIGTLRCSDC